MCVAYNVYDGASLNMDGARLFLELEYLIPSKKFNDLVPFEFL